MISEDQRASRMALRTLSLLATALLISAPLAGAQTIRGSIVDRNDHSISGVLVVLLDSSGTVVARTLAGDDGQYLLRTTSPGAYRVRTLRIGFSPLISPVITIGEGETRTHRVLLDQARVQLVSVTTTVKSSCGRQSCTRRTLSNDTLPGRIFGRVRSGKMDSVGTRGISVSATWNSFSVPTSRGAQLSVTEHEAVTTSTDFGVYRFCSLPTESEIMLRAQPARARAFPATARLTEREPFAAVSLLIDTGQIATAALTGRVTSDESIALRGVEITIPELALSTRSDSSGRFRITDIRPGNYEVVARNVGYGIMTAKIEFTPNHDEERRIVLKRLPVLEEVEINSTYLDSRLRDFETRRKIGNGRFYTRDDLEKVGGRPLAAVIATVSGVRMAVGAGNSSWIASSRVPSGNKPLDDQDVRHGARKLCYAHVYIDGRIVYGGGDREPLFNANSLNADDIEVMEYYAGPGQTPAQYSNLGAVCGVLVIWTRRL